MNETAALTWHNEKRKVSELLPWAMNPRQITEKQAKELTVSLEKFGLVDLPSINLDNTILGGHARCKILALLGRAEDVIEVRVPNRKLTEPEVMELNLRLNKNAGDFDFDALVNNFDQDLLMDVGFSESELAGHDQEPEVEEAKPAEETQLFHVVVDCHNEQEQKATIEKLVAMGLTVSVMNVKPKKAKKKKGEE